MDQARREMIQQERAKHSRLVADAAAAVAAAAAAREHEHEQALDRLTKEWTTKLDQARGREMHQAERLEDAERAHSDASVTTKLLHKAAMIERDSHLLLTSSFAHWKLAAAQIGAAEATTKAASQRAMRKYQLTLKRWLAQVGET
jgi:hypothetical protein